MSSLDEIDPIVEKKTVKICQCILAYLLLFHNEKGLGP